PSPSVLAASRGKSMTAKFSAVTVPSKMPDATPAPELAQQHRLVDPKALQTVAPLSYPVVQRPTVEITRFDRTPSKPGERFDDETYVGTSPHVKHDRERSPMALAKKLVLPGVGFIVLGALIGGFIAFNGDKKKHDAPPVPVQKVVEAPVAPAPAPIAAPVVVARPVVTLTDVRIDSNPAGATVTLVDEKGKSSVIGSTPIATSVDARHQYQVTVELAGKTQSAHLDPAKDQRLMLELPAPAAAPHHHAVAVKAPVAHHVAEAAIKQEEPATVADAGGTGTLMISSKPPCEIMVDGKATGLTTPQRAMSLPAGAHKITLVNAGEHIEQTMTVKITADQATKLVKDLLLP
ncbi:MAG TPA: PEGA domain-containing protein, partial [Kofleriaceae bacterium]